MRYVCRPLFYILLLAAPAIAGASSPPRADSPTDAWATALDRHVADVRRQPLRYERIDAYTKGMTGVARFELHSQDWPASEPSPWLHGIRILIPAPAAPRTAILVVNDGTRHPGPGGEHRPPTNWNEAALVALAEQTGAIVVEIGDVPNQYLRGSDGVARKEDQLVAYSWKKALEGGTTAPFASAHLPMTAAVVRAMDLAEHELRDQHVERFIVTGASKRGWATWLAALADDRVAAIAPVAIDVPDTSALIERTRKSYGGAWPVAFHDYLAAGVLRERDSPAFANLMRLEDPLAYLETRQGRRRLGVPKYLVSASGDDFFLPDSAGRYLSRLPSPTVLRTLPNSDHGGTANALPDALVPFIKRVMTGSRLPAVRHQVKHRGGNPQLRVTFDEQPVQVSQWTAVNPRDRDFRFACGVRYAATTLAPGRRVVAPLHAGPSGWSATFVEARFADGFVVTTPVVVWPDTYPEAPPASTGPACATLPDEQSGTAAG